MYGPGGAGGFLIGLVNSVLSIYSLLILVRALLSWFNINSLSGLYYILIRITEPVLGPIRRLIPLQGIDISPVIAILLIDLVVKRVLLGLLASIF
jgi:YggT family protein